MSELSNTTINGVSYDFKDAGAARQSHSHTKSQITDFPTSMTPTSHTHGNIQNSGTLQTNDITIASGDKIVVTDSSDSSKIARTSISFDGSTATQALTKKGTWETFNNYSHPTSAGNKHIPSGGSSGKILVYGGSSGAASWGDVPCGVIDASSVITLTSSFTLQDGTLFYQGKHIFGSLSLACVGGDDLYTVGSISSTYAPYMAYFYGLGCIYKPPSDPFGTYYQVDHRDILLPSPAQNRALVVLHFDYLTA